ncbi:putative F0F1-ATPase subunit [bacterium BMS3Abin09]|nr:putative F0F1-ATPase subunit [bacterium BMS3Abin09]GBE40716.1 putative F0F1-ATPase subunit [bacterium BMS3Bbin09]
MPDNKKKKTKEERQKRGDFVRFAGMASTVGINMVLSTCVGFALGHYVFDEYLNTHPWFTILMTALGIFAGFKYLFKIAKKAEERDEDGDT